MFPNELTIEDFVAAVSPGADIFAAKSSEGRRLRRTITRGLIHLTLREVMRAMRDGHRGRRASEVQQYYQRNYKGDALDIAESYGRSGRAMPFRFGSDRIVVSDTRFLVRLATQRLGDIIAAQKPHKVCEVGCGHGRNLLYLANRMPSVEFSGYKLTASGIAVARQLQRLDLPRTEYRRLYGVEDVAMENVRRKLSEVVLA